MGGLGERWVFYFKKTEHLTCEAGPPVDGNWPQTFEPPPASGASALLSEADIRDVHVQVGYVPQNACLLHASLRLPGIRSPSNLMTLRALSVDHIVGTTDVAIGSFADNQPCLAQVRSALKSGSLGEHEAMSVKCQ
jgi:hypothetical protein